MKPILVFCVALTAVLTLSLFAKPSHDGKSDALKHVVILVIRHAEKPAKGANLTAAGEARAKAYADYFKNYTVDGKPLKLDHLFAAADSKESRRARLTLEPTSQLLGLKIDNQFADDQFQKLADEIRTKSHGKHMLICWHHGEIPPLIKALGADSRQVIPDAKWPDSVYNWVIQLRYDADGHLLEAKRITTVF